MWVGWVRGGDEGLRAHVDTLGDLMYTHENHVRR